MSEGNGVHTVHTDGVWVNEIGGRQVGGSFDHKDAAVSAGREEAIARGTEHHIHGLDGRVHEKNSHGGRVRLLHEDLAQGHVGTLGALEHGGAQFGVGEGCLVVDVGEGVGLGGAADGREALERGEVRDGVGWRCHGC